MIDLSALRRNAEGATQPQFANWAQAELDAARQTPDGAWLSPEAQALYETEGADRFAKHHGRLARFMKEGEPG